MAKINRFYLLISMLVSYRIGTAMAAGIGIKVINKTTFYSSGTLTIYKSGVSQCEVTGGGRYVLGVGGGGDGALFCSPETGQSTVVRWESDTLQWMQRTDIEDCGFGAVVANDDYYNVVYPVGVRVIAPYGPGDYFLCTTDGWKHVVPYNVSSIHCDMCSDVEARCGTQRGIEVAKIYYNLAEDYGTDMTNANWQVCLYGYSNDFCYDDVGESEYTCPPGMYLVGEDCEECPDADFWEAILSNGKWTKGTIATATSPRNNSADEYTACYIPGSGDHAGDYIDNGGVFHFTSNCYYGA